ETTILNPDLAKFLRERRNWLQKGSEAVDYVRLVAHLAKTTLGVDLADPVNQFEWPALMRLVRSVELEDQLNVSRVQADIARLKKDWSGKDHAALFESAAEAFTAAIHDRRFRMWLEQQANVSVKTTRRFFEELFSASAKDGIALLNYPDLLSFAAILILHEEIETKTLMAELAPLEEKIETKLIRSPKEQGVIRFSKDLDLAEKLIHLKLTREDYLVVMQRETDFSAVAMHARLSKLLSLNGLPAAADDLFVQATLDSALSFYRLSADRDEVLVKKTVALSSANPRGRRGSRVAVLIAGGFHQEGILRELDEQGIAHAVVTPEIKNMPAESLYEKVMSGEDSVLAEALSATAANLMAEILGASNYYTEAAAPHRREAVMLEGLFGWRVKEMMRLGQTPEDIYQALSRGLERASAQGLIGRARLILKDAVQPGSSPELVLSLLDHGAVFHYEITPEGARQTHVERFAQIAQAQGAKSSLRVATPQPGVVSPALQASRSEMRAKSNDDVVMLDPDAVSWLAKLPRNKSYERTLALMKALEEKKRAQTSSLAEVYAQSLTSMGPARNIPVIEAVVDEIASEYNLKTLPIAYRAAVVLQAFDTEFFPEVHRHLLTMLNTVNISNAEDRLSVADYRKLMEIGEREHLTEIDQFILLHTALNRYLIDLPRKERRALEKEAMVVELMKELESPGTGNLRQIVFLTDLHGGTKVGDLIGYSLGLKNYRRIRSVHDLKERLQAEGIDIKNKNILFVGGSDYVDRGPNPYRAFEFVRWLRDNGKLKFINGNHDLWKDWNLLGVHLRVQDALQVIAQSSSLKDSAVARHAGVLKPDDKHMQSRDGTFASFVSTIGKTEEQIAQIQASLNALVQRFLQEIHQEGSETRAEDIIKRYANEVIDFGSNDNHSLEWWARDWYEHAGWADTFLDEMNEILINRLTTKINGFIADSAGTLKGQLETALRAEAQTLPEVLRADRDAFLANLAEGRLFNNISAALFSAHDDVKEEKAKIEELKAKNAQIRKSNESLAAQGRFDEQMPQNSVPTTFPLTAKHAQEYLDKINAQIMALQSLVALPQVSGQDLKLVTADNYRANNVVVDTALWNLKNLRLVYVDAYGNAYLHGIIPIEENSLDFKVQYKDLSGVVAIERMQYDIRRFFETYQTIPDTPNFRATMEREVGEAFRILNNWYSDKTAYLKPAAFQEFLNKGGPAAYSYSADSAFHARVYDPRNGLMHVGHIDLTKMRDAKAPYWISGMRGGTANGDNDISEGYYGLGGVITHFMRAAGGHLTGLRRFGYEETVASLSKDLKDTEKEKKKKEKTLKDLGEITETNEATASVLQQSIGELAAEIDDLKQRLARKKEKVDTDQGETIEDITLHELPESERNNARPFLEGGDYAYYYAQRFLQELIDDYTGLINGAKARGLYDRARYYGTRLSDVEEQLTFLRNQHGKEHPLHPARSEVRLNTAVSFEQYLLDQGRDPEVVLATAVSAAALTVDHDLSRFPEVRERLLGARAVSAEESQQVVPSVEMQFKMNALVKAQETVERPKTVVIVSVNGKVPQIDPSQMDLLPGSRVVILDRLGSEAVGRRHFSKLKLPPDVSAPEHMFFQGEYPTLDELKTIFEKP
ncbi:MAG: metallophosphoesterase, partial [Candidatus Omnitrophica bacterium]|nr:metallophosphoesterase [Candidatus Omnitrophota bacterium]